MDGEDRLEIRQDGYRVVPAALRNAQGTFDAAADRWQALHRAMRDWRMADGLLGVLGRKAEVVSDYNAAVDAIRENLQTGVDGLRAAGDALDNVAKEYEAQDEEYYAKFGWTADQMDDVAPAPN